MLLRRLSSSTLLIFLLAAVPALADDFPEIVNSQKAGEHPPSPKEAAAAIKVPEGFQVTLFAGEPDVAQPIDIEFDDRGRLWVAECYTYNGRNFEGEHRDRIVILEDADNDGRHDKRTVFWDQGRAMTSLCYGFGGLYILNEGTLSHLPDANGDDVPDGPPTVLLDGFDTGPVGHNIVNGLMWGPDGWLYGRHGIQATSYVGKPGDVQSKRTALNCSIWRYHPQRETFEVVCHGTTNPWGMDYDAHGQFFFTNNVIGHLWHVIPGAHYQRMYGEDFNPHLYALIDQTADHYHWEHEGGWTNSRLGDPATSELGGGHAHSGGMIYQGDNWPEEYRGGMFMCNIHGRRVNHDRLVRQGSSYVGKHAEDFLHAGQPWFRGVSMKYGPDGGVYLTDWSDLGECHDHDGVHRTSGRIYKITYGDVSEKERADGGNVSLLSNVKLLGLLSHSNQWYVRRARRVLAERANTRRGLVNDDIVRFSQGKYADTAEIEVMWAFYTANLRTPEQFKVALDNSNEHERVGAIRLMTDEGELSASSLSSFAEMAKSDDSALVRLHLASALQKIPLEKRFPIATNLASHEQDAQDHHLRLMLWYGIEPAVVAHPDEALKFMQQCKWPLLQQYVARRLTYEVEQNPQPVAALYDILLKNSDPNFRREVLTGMVAALSGRRQVKAPASWNKLSEELLRSEDPTVVKLTRELAVVHGDGRALDQVRKLAEDAGKPAEQRRAALDVLITARPVDLPPLLLKLVNDRAVQNTAIRGLALYEEERAPQAILNQYQRLQQEGRQEAIATLSSRPAYARALLAAVAADRIPASDISAFHARQMQSLGDAEITARLTELWGSLRSTPTEKREQIEQYRGKLTDAALAKADLSHGRQLFQKTCANCHTLYGVGENIGPDLTGSNRNNMDYLLENILDPSALVATQFRMSALRLASGQVVTGVIVQQTDQIVTVQTEKERLNLPRSDVEEVKPSPLSLMPDGLLNNLSETDVRDLFGYLQGTRQVELPAETSAE
jgi:putative membrane-bound dehydrogenase-like protein